MRVRALVIGATVLTALVAVVLMSAVVVKMQSDLGGARRAAATYTPAPLAAPSAVPLPVVAVIGDDSTSAAAGSVAAADRWPVLLGAASVVDVKTYASTGAGYLSRGGDGRSFLNEVQRIPSDTAVVIVFGGASDAGATSVSQVRGVSRVVSAVQARAQKAAIVVVGPVTNGGATELQLEQLRTSIADAASSYQLRFTNPVQQAWLNGTAASGSRLTASDQKSLAQHFRVLVDQALPEDVR